MNFQSDIFLIIIYLWSVKGLTDLLLERAKKMKLDFIEQEERTFTKDGVDYIFYINPEPTTKQRIRYMADSAKKQLGKIKDKYESLFAAKFASGCELIKGFPEFFPPLESKELQKSIPQFELNGKPISSNPDSEFYNAEWKELILPKFFNDIIYLATEKFEGVNVQQQAKKIQENENDEIQEMDDLSPLVNNSSSI